MSLTLIEQARLREDMNRHSVGAFSTHTWRFYFSYLLGRNVTLRETDDFLQLCFSEQASQNIERGIDAEAASIWPQALSNTLRQEATGQPRPDTTFRVTVTIERVVKNEATLAEAAQLVMSFPTHEQASAYAVRLYSVARKARNQKASASGSERR